MQLTLISVYEKAEKNASLLKFTSVKGNKYASHGIITWYTSKEASDPSTSRGLGAASSIRLLSERAA